MRVATKELKNRLGHYLRLVRAGETVVITVRGAPVAELRSLAIKRSKTAVLDAMADDGLLLRGTGRGKLAPFEPPTPLRDGDSLSWMVLEDRR